MRRKTKKKNDKKIFIFKKIIILIFVVFAGIFAVKSIRHFLYTSDLFTVTAIESDPSLQFIRSSDLSGMKGKNIFRIDIKGFQQRLRSGYSGIEDLRVYRKLPNTVLITARKRTPFVVIVFDGKRIVVDEEGWVLAFGPDSAGDLPVIRGVEVMSRAAIGTPIEDRHLKAALEVVKAFSDNQRLERFQIEYADVKNLSKIYMGLSNQMDVILDREKIPGKMDKLALVLSQDKLDFGRINYIDLRFKEPVIGQK